MASIVVRWLPINDDLANCDGDNEHEERTVNQFGVACQPVWEVDVKIIAG